MRIRTWIYAGMCILLGSLFVPLPEEDFREESVHSLRIVDRNGVLLRELLNDSEGRGQWRRLDDISPFLAEATIAIEDRRFRSHPGIDPLAILRATWQNVQAGRLISGGSTITQQVIRNVYHHPRTLPHKVLEAWLALRLENALSKDRILENYLNRVPYGNGLIGAEAASRQYFGKPARDLSLAEAAFLAGLPNSPTLLNPYRRMPDALARQHSVLKAMADQGRINMEELTRAARQPLELVPAEVSFRAPHAVDMAVRSLAHLPSVSLIRTTIDLEIQRAAEWLVRGHLRQLVRKDVTNAAVVVIDNKTLEVLALVGSADYFDERIQGQVNGAIARRQPGSAVKPFTYGLAFEGPFTPADVVADVPTSIPDHGGDYIPENYDRRYHGPVRLRSALACSYNVPAVRVLSTVGRENLLQRMRDAGLTTLERPSIYYGYGLTLGNGEVTLLELAQAYAAFANGGIFREAIMADSVVMMDGSPHREQRKDTRRVFTDRSSWLVTDILKDQDARRPAFGHAFTFPFECAVKTGTTKDYRDNWTIGYTTAYTVGVWVGNFDGKPMKGVSGVTGAGKIFEDIMTWLNVNSSTSDAAPFRRPPGIVSREVCSLSGRLPSASCGALLTEWFDESRLPADRCNIHLVYEWADESGHRQTGTFAVLPPEYREWALDQRIPVPPAHASVLMTPEKAPVKRPLALLAPHNGQQFKVDPVLRQEFQAIRILAHVDPGVEKVTVRVGSGERFAYDAGMTWWNLKKGTHQILLEGLRGGKKIQSNEVTINVD